MGSMSSLIADDERSEREHKWKEKQRKEADIAAKIAKRKEACKEAWDRYLAGDGENGIDFPKVLEYARELESEVKVLRQQVAFADKVRDTLRMFLDVR